MIRYFSTLFLHLILGLSSYCAAKGRETTQVITISYLYHFFGKFFIHCSDQRTQLEGAQGNPCKQLHRFVHGSLQCELDLA